jgi:CBS domain-containing protein
MSEGGDARPAEAVTPKKENIAMRHPRRAITRDIRTRQPKRRGRERAELEAQTWPDTLRVSDVMTRGPVTIRQTATIGAAWKTMRARRLRHLPVLGSDGRLVGIVTDRDLRQVILDPDIQAQLGVAPRALNVLTVGEVMTWGAITVRPDSDLREAARVMHAHKVGALPVVEHGRLVGILAETDLVKTFIDALGQGVLSKLERWALEQ